MTGVSLQPELLLRERAWLHALARQLVQPHEGADELAHDTLTAALLQPQPRAAGLRGWLAAILRKQLAGRRRAELRRRARESLAARPEAQPATLDTVARFELQRNVADAVLALAEPYRTTVLLRCWDDLPPAAIAQRMGVPVETVRTRWKRGLALLRERLDRAHGGDRAAWVVALGAVVPAPAPVASSLSLLAGVSLMAVWIKGVVAAVLAAAAIWLFVTAPWSAPDALPPVERASAASSTPASAALPGDAAAPLVERIAATAERVALPDPTAAAWLYVRGTVVDDATGAPLPGAAVHLVTWPNGEAAPDVAAGTDGTFVLHDARPRDRKVWQVVARTDDHAAARADVRIVTPNEGRHEVQEIDVGTLRLVRGTWFAGQVVDQDGRGVAGAELLLPLQFANYDPHRGPQGMLQRTASLGHSGAGGWFRLAEPVAPDVQHQNLLFALTARGIGWCRFEPSKQRREVQDLVIRLAPNGGLRVVVEAPDGQPFAGALVRALPRFGPVGITRRDWILEVAGPESLRARFRGETDSRGELRLSDLPIGERDLHFNAGGTERDYELWVQAEGLPAQPLQSFQLQPGTEQLLVVRLVAARQVRVAVLVHDDLGAPIADTLVTVDAAPPVQGRTDGLGRVELAVAAMPRLSVSAAAPGHRAAHTQLELAAAADVQTTLVLARTLQLDGRVVDQTGAPAPGMHLFVDQREVGVTDTDGRFHVDAFPMGERRVVVAVGPSMDPIGWTGLQQPQSIDAARGPVTIVMHRRPGAIDVRAAIVDATSGEPLEPVGVFLRLHHLETDQFFFPKRTQNEPGRVTSLATPAGRWQLGVRTTTGQRGAVEFTLVEGQAPLDLRLALPLPGTVTGRLVFAGVPPPAMVTLAVAHATYDRRVAVQFRYPGRWHVDPVSQAVTGAQHGHTGSLRLQPAQNATFQLDSADPTDELVFTVHGEGLAGRATVRIAPGETRELVVEVTAKGK